MKEDFIDWMSSVNFLIVFKAAKWWMKMLLIILSPFLLLFWISWALFGFIMLAIEAGIDENF